MAEGSVPTVIIGTAVAAARFAMSAGTEDVDVHVVTNLRELDEVRQAIRGTQPIVVLLPGWSRTGMMHEAVLYMLGALDGMVAT